MLRGSTSLLALVALAPACFSPGGNDSSTSSTSTTSESTGTMSGSTTSAGTTAPTTTSDATGTSATSGSPTSDATATSSEPTTTATSDATGTSTTSATTSNSTETTTQSGRCGDGIITPDEECDDGDNNDLVDCTHECKFNVCGDGIFHPDHEECDGGNDCAADCRRTFLRVFVSSDSYLGSFGGYEGADVWCQNLANSAELIGHWKAWLGSATMPAADRFVHSPKPWRIVYTDDLVANDWTDLVDGDIGTPINITEKSEILMLPANCDGCPVWTGTSAGGLPLASNCVDWESNDPGAMGAFGTCMASDAKWTENCSTATCDKSFRLYCFEQALPP